MKRLISMATIASIAAACTLTGCKSMPTVEQMYSTSQAVGYAAAVVANQTKIDDEARNATVDIINTVKYVTPKNGETFRDAWMPIAISHTDKLLESGKIDKYQAEMIKGAVNVLVLGIDYIFVRNEKAFEYKELMLAAINGFTSSFLEAFRPVNASDRVIAVPGDTERSARAIDREAYSTIRGILGK